MTQNTSVISGVVKDSNGNPVSAARVSFVSGPVPLPDIAGLTDVDGTFVLSAPAPGDYIIEVVTNQYITKKVKVSVSSDEQKRIELNLSN